MGKKEVIRDGNFFKTTGRLENFSYFFINSGFNVCLGFVTQPHLFLSF
jgi:hypothetical protein